MKHAEYVYTTGMTADEVDEYLRTGDHGVLGLADGDEAYALPLSYHYDGERILLRVSEHDDDATKLRFLESTDVATFVRYDAAEGGSWSIHVRGPVAPWETDVDEATINEWFPPFRLFDEGVDDVTFSLWTIEFEYVTGRRTIE